MFFSFYLNFSFLISLTKLSVCLLLYFSIMLGLLIYIQKKIYFIHFLVYLYAHMVMYLFHFLKYSAYHQNKM